MKAIGIDKLIEQDARLYLSRLFRNARAVNPAIARLLRRRFNELGVPASVVVEQLMELKCPNDERVQ